MLVYLILGNIIRLTDKNSKDVLDKAVKFLKEGKIVAYPTETYYALGAKFDSTDALNKLIYLKKRPKERAFTLIAGGQEALLKAITGVSGQAGRLMESFWPGPLTILFPVRKDLPEDVVNLIACEGKVAIRVPGESFALRLAIRAGFPITATSANPSGMPPPVTAKDVEEYFGGGVDLIVDGGTTTGGPPSTIVDFEGGEVVIVRQGAVELSSLLAVSLKSAYEGISPFIEKHTSRVCPECERVCCIDRHGTYEEEDMRFFSALGRVPDVPRPKERDTEPCRNLSVGGCDLPRWVRPFRCTWYFCPPLLEEISRGNARDYRAFVSALQGLLALRRRLIRIR